MGVHSFEPFVWMFPCYFLANNVTVKPESGEVVFDDNIRVIAPEMTVGGEKRLAIFTDSYLADEFRDLCPAEMDVRRLSIPRPKALMRLLDLAQSKYQHVVVDPNPKTRYGRSFLIVDLIPEVQDWIDHPDDPIAPLGE